jgi:hypothetical protein
MEREPASCANAENSDETYLAQSRGMCRVCRQIVPARYKARGGRVYLERRCPEHGNAEALVAGDLGWYLSAMQSDVASRPPPKVIGKRHAGCPHACGPCLFHGQRCQLPVIPITNACNLRCPICFGYNRADKPYFMPAQEFARQIDFLLEATSGVDLINITGGEPTLHPDLLSILEIAKRPGIGRVTLNSNGLLIGRRPELAKALADMGIYVVLSLDTLQSERSVRIHGVDLVADKLRALEALETNHVQTTLLPVLIPGLNDDEMGTWLDWLCNRPFVRSLTIQTMTYTGQGGADFLPRELLPVDLVERLIEKASGGHIAVPDFMPLPTAHPLCYGVAYLVTDEKTGVHPLARLLDRRTLAAMAQDGYLLHPSDDTEADLKLAVDRLWSEGREPGLLQALRFMLRSVYPPGQALPMHERQRQAEQHVKTIYVHAHMDEDNYEVGRAMRCPDQVVVDGSRLIGACNFNLMYRMPDSRFGAAP